MTDLGNAFYTAQIGNDYGRDVAGRTINDFLDRLYSLPACSDGRKYMEEMRLSAITLGNGKASRKREYRDTLENATHERDKQLAGLNGKGFLGKTLENVQTTAAGVGSFFIARSLLRYFDVDLSPEAESGISFAAGYTAAEAVDHIEELIRSRKVHRITRRYDSAVQGAKKEYKRFIKDEYGLALEKCRKAWDASFGESVSPDETPTSCADMEPFELAA